MLPTLDNLRAVSKIKISPSVLSNINSVLAGLTAYAENPNIQLGYPHRLAHYLAQLAHESGGFKYDKEIWGNTAAQQKYDTRTDLGNTAAVDGDGKLYMGRSGIQLTGKANYQAFTKWAKTIDVNSPDFVASPDSVNTDPWEGLAPIWFWTVGNRTGKSLNTYADQNDIEMITRIVNGGTNGLADRMDYYTRIGLVLLGYDVSTKDKLDISIRQFQVKSSLDADGIDGPRTRSAIHMALVAISKPEEKVTKAPVTETTTVAVPVIPKDIDSPNKDLRAIVVAGVTAVSASPVAKPLLDTFGGLSQTVQMLLIAVGVGALIYIFVSRQLLAKRASTIIQEAADRNANTL